MEIQLGNDFKEIATRIIAEKKSDAEWAAIESDDMFQQGSFSGGYDAVEQAFCFSCYDDSGIEYWFQLTLPELARVAEADLNWVVARPAD